jgi:hypothetical protein
MNASRFSLRPARALSVWLSQKPRGWAMALSAQKQKMRLSVDDHWSMRAHYHGLRAVARALDLRDFVELPGPRGRKQPYHYRPSAMRNGLSSAA